LNLINDVLDLSKIEAGQLTLSPNDYVMGHIMRSVVASTETQARAKGISLVASLVLGVGFIAGAVRLYRRADRRSALVLYLYSLAYLALLFSAMVVDVHL